MKYLNYSAGSLIFREGQEQQVMYEIQEGSVGIYLDYGTETERQLAVLKQEQLLGEMALIEDAPRSATAVALEDGTVLREISEEDYNRFFREKPELLLRILQQLSDRIRENTEKYQAVCRTLRESLKAEAAGEEKSPELTQQVESFRRDSGRKRVKAVGLRSSFYDYVLEDLAACEGKRDVVRVSLVERLAIHAIDPAEMHVNPDDEFADPDVGPSDRIINEYVYDIRRLWSERKPIFPEPVAVYKLKQGGYMILNGHHRWAAALKTGFGKIRAVIMNPPQ